MKNRISRRSFLKKTAAAAAGTALFPLASFNCSTGEFDVLITGGSVIDGTGTAPFAADIAIRAGRIVEIGTFRNSSSKSVLDATGKIVSPGFIDIHSHTDARLIRTPGADSKIFQGVTLDLGGNCGGSPFPRKKDGIENIGSAADLTGYSDFASRLQEKPFAMNCSLLIGHGTIRSQVLGDENRVPTTGELNLMKDIVRLAMEQGAAGLSSGLEYTPSGYAQKDEMTELCKVVAEYGGIYATHMRSEDEKLVEAVEEALQTARESGVSLQISHLKAAGKPNWHKIDKVIGLIEKAQSEGMNVHCDRYPYLAYSTGMGIFFPGWAHEGGREAFLNRLKNSRKEMKKETLVKLEANGGWETIMLSSLSNDENTEFLGRRVDEIAASLKKDPYEFVCDLLISEGGGASIVGFGMGEENTDRIISLPYAMIGSDGIAMSIDASGNRGKPHPRSFGSFPKAIREYVNEKKLMPLHEMIRKMTSLPADKIGLKDRGRITKGAVADIAVFDPVEITDKSTYLEPWHYSEGVTHVIVNGETVVKNGIQTGALPGKLVSRY